MPDNDKLPDKAKDRDKTSKEVGNDNESIENEEIVSDVDVESEERITQRNPRVDQEREGKDDDMEGHHEDTEEPAEND
jgi:hypothetical protein